MLESGIGLRSIKHINSVAMLCLAWIFETDSGTWANLVRVRHFTTKGKFVTFIKSSMWSGVRAWQNLLLDSSRWRLRDRSKISFWHDCWLQDSVMALTNLPPHISFQLQSKINDFIQYKTWKIPWSMEEHYPTIVQQIKNVVIPLGQRSDTLDWIYSSSSVLMFKEAYKFVHGDHPTKPWTGKIWR